MLCFCFMLYVLMLCYVMFYVICYVFLLCYVMFLLYVMLCHMFWNEVKIPIKLKCYKVNMAYLKK